MSNPNPAGTVIVLNFQGAEWLDDGLESLANQTATGFEVLVVDNASTDGSASIAKRHSVSLVQLPKNVGFSSGNNAGARAARGEWLVFVNNDMRFAPEFVEQITEPLRDTSVFGVDVSHRDWQGHTSHGATGVALRNRLGGLLRTIEYPERLPATAVDVPFVCGGAVAVRRTHFETLGGFDERFFAGSEDVDLCWRAAARLAHRLLASGAVRTPCRRRVLNRPGRSPSKKSGGEGPSRIRGETPSATGSSRRLVTVVPRARCGPDSGAPSPVRAGCFRGWLRTVRGCIVLRRPAPPSICET